MLGVHKARVKLEMSHCKNFTSVINLKDYLQYKCNDTVISFSFYKYMMGWYCNEVRYCIPNKDVEEFILDKESKEIWVYYGYDTWLYDVPDLNMTMWVHMIQDGNKSMFIYKF